MARRNRRGTEAGEPIIGLLTIELHDPHSRSLKEKRMVVKAIKDRLRGRFNAAVAETGYQDLWQRGVISVVTVGSDRKGIEATLDSMARDVEKRYPSETVEISIELID
jgi:uncharacterized protein YlxP (DUF503 family)